MTTMTSTGPGQSQECPMWVEATQTLRRSSASLTPLSVSWIRSGTARTVTAAHGMLAPYFFFFFHFLEICLGWTFLEHHLELDIWSFPQISGNFSYSSTKFSVLLFLQMWLFWECPVSSVHILHFHLFSFYTFSNNLDIFSYYQFCWFF